MSFVTVGVRDDALAAYVDRGVSPPTTSCRTGPRTRGLTSSGTRSSCSRAGWPRPALGPLPPRGCGVEAAAPRRRREAAGSVIDTLRLHGNALDGDASVTSAQPSTAHRSCPSLGQPVGLSPCLPAS